MSINTQEYYVYHSRKARELAAAAVEPKMAAIHMEMAERYDLLASELKPRTDLRWCAFTGGPAPAG